MTASVYHASKTDAIDKALTANREWKIESGGMSYPGSKVIYRELCHSAHQSVSSLDNRLTQNGIFMLNCPPLNILPLMTLVFYCLKDTFLDLDTCIALSQS